MSNANLLLPLRVPELGPSLGKLVSGTERPTHWIPLDTVRYRLATRIIGIDFYSYEIEVITFDHCGCPDAVSHNYLYFIVALEKYNSIGDSTPFFHTTGVRTYCCGEGPNTT